MIEIRHIGKSADDLRFFILSDGQHAGGITVHSVNKPLFSYGIAIAKEQRRKGVAKAALSLLFEEMKHQGFTKVVVQVAPENKASLALHASLGFERTAQDSHTVTMQLTIDQSL